MQPVKIAILALWAADLYEDEILDIITAETQEKYESIIRHYGASCIELPIDTDVTVGMWYDRKNSTPENPIFLPIERRRYRYKKLKSIYDKKVLNEIRNQYTDNDEFKILRQGIMNPNDPKFLKYNTFVEETKERIYHEIFDDKIIEH